DFRVTRACLDLRSLDDAIFSDQQPDDGLAANAAITQRGRIIAYQRFTYILAIQQIRFDRVRCKSWTAGRCVLDRLRTIRIETLQIDEHGDLGRIRRPNADLLTIFPGRLEARHAGYAENQ